MCHYFYGKDDEINQFWIFIRQNLLGAKIHGLGTHILTNNFNLNMGKLKYIK